MSTPVSTGNPHERGILNYLFDSNYIVYKMMDDLNEYWVFRLALNLLGYATVVVPMALLYYWLKSNGYISRTEAAIRNQVPVDWMQKAVGLLYIGRTLPEKGTAVSSDGVQPVVQRTRACQLLVLLFCFAGLQVSYLTWGVLQEKIMTREYSGRDGHSGKFTDSLFLVFVNRISAFLLAVLYVYMSVQPLHRVPLYKYGYSSFSNIMSSWCQYEVLKYVSFPTQVLGKASKIIPVMLMGKIVSSKTYHAHEYATAAMISLGTAMFLLAKGLDHHEQHTTTVSGLILMLGYLLFDSFTSNWQGELFTTYKMTSMQMMAGVNLFSSLFTLVSLLEQGTFFRSFAFMMKHEAFIFDTVLLSVCSAVGQLFIFYTISQFGPVTFAIIMTIRQALAIFLSCIIFGHQISPVGVVGVLVVFVALFLRMYLNQASKKRRQITTPPSVDKV